MVRHLQWLRSSFCGTTSVTMGMCTTAYVARLRACGFRIDLNSYTLVLNPRCSKAQLLPPAASGGVIPICYSPPVFNQFLTSGGTGSTPLRV
jgi:hypothetical protein